MNAATGPYVGLDYFVEEDADLFFGRDSERKRISGNLRASRLTLLYAESGVGKSSLLRAGVSASIRRHAERSVGERGSAGFVPVVFSNWRGDATADLIAALEAAARPLRANGGELAPRHDALDHAIEDVAASLDATPLLILDQFEEHFLGAVADADRFDEELARCVNRRDLRGHFLISIREDAYSLIGSRFKARIPNVYANFLHLDFLDERAAREAVIRPLVAYNGRLPADAPRVEIEPALVGAVIDQVRRGRVTIGDGGGMRPGGADDRVRVETAYLQLVMRRIWEEEVAAGSQRLRLETLRRLGGADTIVHAHLDDAMARLPADQRDAAAAALRFLVTSAGRKIALSAEELREFADVEAASLEPALEHLERSRILRPVPAAEPDRVTRHEIFHDVLAPAIRDWRRAETEHRLEQVHRRARRLERRTRVLAAAVVALAAVAAGLAVYLFNPGPVRRLELRAVDARFFVRGAGAADPRLLLITVDDRAIRRFGTDAAGRPPRRVYALILDRVRAGRPAVIALDVSFRGPQDAQDDRALLAAFRRTRDRLVLAYKTSTTVTNARTGTQSIRPDIFGQPDLTIGVRTGWAGIPDDPDGRNRRAEYVSDLEPTDDVRLAPRRVQTFAFAAADLARGGALAPRVYDLPTADRSAWGNQTRRSTWIDFAGPPGTVRRVSAVDVVAGRLPPRAFRDKLVVIGVTATGTNDMHATPLARDPEMPGAELQANAIATIVHNSPLRNTSTLMDVIAVVLLGAVPALAGLSRSRPRIAAAIAAGLIAFLAVAQLAFQAGWILPVVAPLGALVAATVGLIALWGRRTVRRHRAAQAPS